MIVSTVNKTGIKNLKIMKHIAKCDRRATRYTDPGDLPQNSSQSLYYQYVLRLEYAMKRFNKLKIQPEKAKEIHITIVPDLERKFYLCTISVFTKMSLEWFLNKYVLNSKTCMYAFVIFSIAHKTFTLESFTIISNSTEFNKFFSGSFFCNYLH